MSETLPQIPFELQILSQAKNYQAWITDTISPYLGESILEVGAGMGNQSVWLPVRKNLFITEASRDLFPLLQKNISEKFTDDPRVKTELVDLAQDWTSPFKKQQIDTIVSFNVLEHVEDDAKAILSFYEILKANQQPGPRRIITFVPAHQWAHGTMDQAFGHYRRYSHRDFERMAQKLNLKVKTSYRYFNIFGLPGWLMMGKVLKKSEIGMGAVRSFELLCPFLRHIDDFIGGTLRVPLGQSLLYVMELDKSLGL
jgi:SAM-dependent methyltransferase